MTTAREHVVEVRRAPGRHDQGRLSARVLGTEQSHDGHHALVARPQHVHVRMIGPLTIVGSDRERSGRDIGAVKTRALLELLLLSRGRPISKDELVHSLWGAGRSMPSDPFRTLEHYVCVLRASLTPDRSLGRTLLVTGTNSYLLDPESVDVDLDRFEALLRRASTATSARRRELLEQAVGMATDDLLADSPIPAAAVRERESHRETVAGAHLCLAAGALIAGELHRAVWHGEAALRCTPFSEHAYRLLIVAHHGLGDSDLARLTLRRCFTTLQRGLGIEPTAQTLTLVGHAQAGATLDELVAMLQPALAA